MENKIAKALKLIAYCIYGFGFFAGMAFSTVTVPDYFGYGSTTTFVWSLAFAIWASATVSGTLFLGFSEVIKLLQLLLDKPVETK